jgi:hypothetical protein
MTSNLQRRTPQQKFVLLFEAAKRSLLSAQMIISRLGDELSSVEPDIRAGVKIGEKITPALLSCVSFVDFAHRYGELAAQLPMVNKSAPEMRELKAALGTVEVMRHHLQHLRGDLSSNDEIDYPILGSVSWASGDDCFTAYLTQPTSSSVAGLGYDLQEKRWLAKYQYRVRETHVDLDTALAAMQSNYSWIVTVATFEKPEDSVLTWGETHCFCATINPGPGPHPNDTVELPPSGRYLRVGATLDSRD